MKLAIVGSGISGMICAHYLKDKYDITIFEKNDYLGGHTHTHDIKENRRWFTIDTGFIVFNLKTYPNLLELFSELGIERQMSNMSFSVYNKKNKLQYGSQNIFGQRKNMISYQFWKFLMEIKHFFKVALRDREKPNDGISVREYAKREGLSDFFIDNYLVPMSSAVWSMPHESVYDMPISLLLPFFYNHGLLGIRKQLDWYTVKGGSNKYIKKIIEDSKLRIHLSEPAESVKQNKMFIELKTKKKTYRFDKVIMASHADQSLKLVKGLKKDKMDMLRAFKYTPNKAVLHTDEEIMPIRAVWSSWNHVISKKGETSTVYWMNKLQNLPTKKNYFVSINPFQNINKKKIIKKIDYYHPSFTLQNFELQKRLHRINEDTNIYFAGAYFGYGFHEDGAKAGKSVVEKLR